MRLFNVSFLTLALLASSRLLASEGFDDVMKLSKAGLSQDVMLAYVNSTPTNYDPNADEIKQLRDSGVSATVIVAMIDHNKSTGSTAATTDSNSNSNQQPQANNPAQNSNYVPPSNSGTGNGPSSPGSDLGPDSSAPA